MSLLSQPTEAQEIPVEEEIDVVGNDISNDSRHEAAAQTEDHAQHNGHMQSVKGGETANSMAEEQQKEEHVEHTHEEEQHEEVQEEHGKDHTEHAGQEAAALAEQAAEEPAAHEVKPEAAHEEEFRQPEQPNEHLTRAELEQAHAPTVERERDEETLEVTYTADVGKVPEDAHGRAGAGASTSGGKMLLMAAHPQLAQDVRAAFAGVPRVKPQWRDRHLKILIVGESGLGKTTFIKNLLAPYAQDPNLAVNDAPGSEEALHKFRVNPERMCTTVVVNDHSSLTSFNYRVQDTPGYNTLEDARAPIKEHIMQQQKRYCEREQDMKRHGPLHAFPDARVDVALFFIPPHRLRPIDVDFITELSELVPVVPILAKADSMTVEELQTFRRDVRDALQQAGKGARKDLLGAFSGEALDAAGARRDAPPFAVVSSTTMDLSVGRFWPVRVYPWGTCEALSSVHSDVGALKRLLFEEGYEELKGATEARYYAFRSGHLLEDPSQPIQRGNALQHVWRALAKPHSGERRRVKEAAGTTLKFLGAAAVFYVGVSYALGGERRLRKDFDKLQEKGAVAADWTLEKASTATAVAADKAQDLGAKALDTAAAVTDQATDIAAAKTHEGSRHAAWFLRRKGRHVVSKVSDKAGDLADVAKGKAADLADVAREKAGQVKGAVADRLTSAEELEQRRIEAEEEERAREEAERRSHRWGPFGLFRK